jgi:hypothetical protein
MSNELDHVNESFEIEEIFRRTIEAFQMEEILYIISFKDIAETFENASDRIHEIFDALLDKILTLNFFHDNLTIPINIPFVRVDEITLSLIIDTLDHVIQSYKEQTVSDNNQFHARVQIQKLPFGSGRATNINKKNKMPNITKERKQKK